MRSYFLPAQIHVAIITPTGGCLLTAPAQSITQGVMVSLLHKANNRWKPPQSTPRDGFNDKIISPPLYCRQEATQAACEGSLGLFVGELGCKQQHGFLVAVISLHLMMSECDRPISVNMQQMKCITMCEWDSLISFPHRSGVFWGGKMSSIDFRDGKNKASRRTPEFNMQWQMDGGMRRNTLESNGV